jgi:serine/threonine-protein kinase
VRRNRLSTSLATLAIIALLAGLVTAMCQSRAAQAVAAHAEIERGKATATRDFLISVFQASDPRIAQDKPRGQVTARELLDNSAQHIHTTFSNHPETELELLGLTASIYRELGEEDRFRSLRDQQVELAHRLYGDLHPIVIEKLMEDAHAASDAGDDKSAKALLAQADVFIRRAGLDRSALRARWWYELSESLWTEPPPRTALVEAIHKSVDLYAAVAPQDPGYVSALNTLGNEHSSRFDDVEAVKIYRRAIAVAGASPNRDEAELQSLISNLAESLLYSGDFDGAETMNKASIELARRTNGEDHVRYWRSMAEYAYEVHLRGDRDRALDMFKTLINSFPAAMTPLQSKNAADVEDLYARCLTADGSAREAIPILESLERIFGVSSPFEFDLRVTQGVLGEAYALAGRSADAKRELRASLDGWEAKSERDSYPLLNSREKWGRFLLAQGDLEGAEGQFREILLQSHSRNFMPTVRAQIGEVQIAIAHQNIEAALEKSHIALDMLDDMKGVRDMRLWPEAWVARSEALRLSRDLAGARQWALRALEASQKYDAPGAASIAKAKDALQRAGGVPQA